MNAPRMTPAPGERLLRYVGDRLRVRLETADAGPGCRAFLRTNLTRGAVARAEVVAASGIVLPGEAPFAGASWRDIPLVREDGGFGLDLALLEVGFFHAKAYATDPGGHQRWPDGPDLGISVHPSALRTANLVYCAFPRVFGAAERQIPPSAADVVGGLDAGGFTVIPPSGKLRDLTRAVPHIMDVLGFRALHLLPVGPVPTTYARMGRYGSPYAQLDLTRIDPALVEHDRRTTAVDQFRELADAVHARSGLVLLDVVLNHTGWGSTMMDEHPEWFRRTEDGHFESPGAWGTVWEDLVELDQRNVPMWHELAESLVTWCRRGVDGFRCDAGYMVPVPVWQYVIARVRTEFPGCVFLLEGLGGAWSATEALLTDGGMQWAYSELFQNFSPTEVSGYLDHSLRQSERVGLLMHYAETHDNLRLARRGAAHSLLRNRLSALASSSGAYAITAGVEWLATEKIDVHEGRPLGFGSEPNLVGEISRLTQLLAEHPCFFDGARTRRISADDSPVLALARDSATGEDHCVVLVNLSDDAPNAAELPGEAWLHGGEKRVDLLGGRVPVAEWVAGDRVRVSLEAGQSVCLASTVTPRGLPGEAYRVRRAQAEWALGAIACVLPHEEIGPADFVALAEHATSDPGAFLGSLPNLDGRAARGDLLHALVAARARDGYPPVVTWRLEDAGRVTLVPPGHWLLVVDPDMFEVDLDLPGVPRRQRGTPTAVGHVLAIPPQNGAERDVELRLDRYGDLKAPTPAVVRLLAERGMVTRRESLAAAEHVLLTNGRGGMARLHVDLGHVTSKYDCLLGANLHPSVPCDRHVLVKRLRAWVNADGFITPLSRENTVAVEPGPPAQWSFDAHAGDGRHVRLDVEVELVYGENTAAVRVFRPEDATPNALPRDREVRLTLRLDLEDRSYHGETVGGPDVDAHFVTHTRASSDGAGFVFEPAHDRRLLAVVDHGAFHLAPEWSHGLLHPEEAQRGQQDRGDAWSPGWFDVELTPGSSMALRVTAEPDEPISVTGLAPSTPAPAEDPFIAALGRATTDFLVRRSGGVTVIAGYPWFLDWGRDSLIAARGLVACGFVAEARSVLHTFARFEKEGTLPNFLAGDGAGSRESSDAPLWFALACDEYAAREGDAVLEVERSGRTLADVLESIGTHYLSGTANGVIVDPESGLPWSPAHFTWMDTNHPAASPREGYPIELAALFVRLCSLLDRIGARSPGTPWRDWAGRARDALSLYHREGLGFSSDTLHAPRGVPAAAAHGDDHLRPNQLFTVSLGLVGGRRARRMVDAVSKWLLVPGALRTLAPRAVETPLPVVRDGVLLNDPGFPYRGRYEGDEDTRRKPAYHNGTAWPWLLPTFAESLVKAWPGDGNARDAARAILGSTARLLGTGTIGQLPEILDGDAPHAERGCDAQAWSVTETLRVALWLENDP